MEMSLKVQLREKGEKLTSDFIAAIVYGQSAENILVKVKANDFVKIYEQAGESNLIKLEIEGQNPFQVLIKDTQRDILKDFFIHADFYRVDMSKELSAEIPLEFIGESKAVKEQGALLNKAIDEVSVECLPQDLVSHIEIDISVLENIGDAIFIKDINVPQGIKIMNNIDDVVVTVTEQVQEEEEQVEASSEEEAKEAEKKEAEKKEDKKAEAADEKK